MKLTMAMILSALLVASCANSLEKIVDDHHQQRIDESNANKPLTKGAADGMGSYIAETAPHMTVQPGTAGAGATADNKKTPQ